MKCFILLLILVVNVAKAQNIRINFDLDNARQTLMLLDKKEISEKEMNTFLALPGTKALIRKVQSTADTASDALRKAAVEKPLSAEQGFRFQYDGIKKKSAGFNDFISALENRKDSITKVVQQKLGYYVPAGKNIDVTLYGLMGSYSGGWAFGNDPNSFYIGLHFKMDDINGVVNTAEHELFHIIQNQLYKGGDTVYKKLAKINDGYGMAYGIMYYLYKEGTAEYVADLKEAAVNSSSSKDLYIKMAVNEKREPEVFYLVERMILDLYTNPSAADYDRTYNILFDMKWNNPAYYVGLVMSKELVKAYGKEYIKNSLQKDPVFFFKDYIAVTKDNKNVVHFSEALEKLVNKMADEIK